MVLENKFWSLQCVNWKDKIKEIIFLEIYLVYWIMRSNSNKLRLNTLKKKFLEFYSVKLEKEIKENKFYKFIWL